jgi:hypothetical protein
MYEHLKHLESLLANTKNLLQEIALSKKTRDFHSKNGKLISSFYIDFDHPKFVNLKKNLEILYHENGIGFKLMSKLLGNVSYTQIRNIFNKLKIDKRNKDSFITECLKNVRSENAKKNNPWKDWTNNENIKNMHKNSNRFLGGWYFNKSNSKFVWLRSSWEYGYASYLDSQNLFWDVESRSYLLNNGKYYRPDFFIFDNKKLLKIVEIKSTWSNGSKERIDKFESFKKEYPEINCKIILDDELFKLINKTQKQILLEWKKNRKMEKNYD